MLSFTCLWAVRQLALPAVLRPAAAAAAAATAHEAPARRHWGLLLVAGGMALISMWVTAAALLDRGRSQSSGLADRLAPALTFGEAGRAQQALQALQQVPEVQRAWLTRFDGQVLAAYVAKPQPLVPAGAAAGPDRIASAACPAATAAPGWVLHLDHLLLRQPVRFQGVPVGSLCLRVGLTALYRQAAWTGAAGLLMCGLASLLGDRRRLTGGPA